VTVLYYRRNKLNQAPTRAMAYHRHYKHALPKSEDIKITHLLFCCVTVHSCTSVTQYTANIEIISIWSADRSCLMLRASKGTMNLFANGLTCGPVWSRHSPLLSFCFFSDATATSDEHKGSSTPSSTGPLVCPADTCHDSITLIVTSDETKHNTRKREAGT
jgi:hypothetical protein